MGRRLRYIPYDSTLVEVTNRTIHGRLLLLPSKKLREITLGAIGRAQRRYGVDIHAFVFLSNHYHLLVSVHDAQQLARFVGYFESKLAKEVGRLTNWRDKIWARRYTDIPVSNEEAAQVRRLQYILSHGVKEGLVNHPAEWSGAHTVDALLDGTPLKGLWYNRTAEYKARMGRIAYQPNDFAEPETVTLSPLPCWAGESAETIQQRCRDLVTGIVEAARADPARGRRIVEGLRPTDRPRYSKRSPAPWFHCATKAARLELKRAYSRFLEAYREASRSWMRGELTAPFPEGCFPPPRPFIAE